uniref:hypothetical protein n=1 Tax=Faecalibacterium sp. TaxID=1971605 RepID=UPI004027AA86
MKYIDINRKFTETVSSYIAQGYIINTASMSGGQGEIAHIDLTDGKQIVRVLLDRFSEWEDYNQLGGLKLMVGIATDNVKPNDNQRRDVIWNNRLEVISCEKFYEVSSSFDDSAFYGTREDATAANKKRFERYCRRDCRIKKYLPEKASPLVKEFIHRKFGLKRVVVSNIQITKQNSVYTVIYNNHSAQLH